MFDVHVLPTPIVVARCANFFNMPSFFVRQLYHTMNIPEHYKQLRAAVPFDSVSIGYASIDLSPVAELEAAQRGYSIVPAGQTTDWRAEWLVIGSEGLCGDPIFIDTSDASFPVYTAAHGMGEWSPQVVASSFRHFIQILERLQVLARGRATPVEMEKHPLPDSEREAFIDSIRRDSADADVSFWELICETDA